MYQEPYRNYYNNIDLLEMLDDTYQEVTIYIS